MMHASPVAAVGGRPFYYNWIRQRDSFSRLYDTSNGGLTYLRIIRSIIAGTSTFILLVAGSLSGCETKGPISFYSLPAASSCLFVYSQDTTSGRDGSAEWDARPE
ncbi:uncharacterized protein LOC112495281 [Cephus cinctus]|uniref:Uncharacterized protein LOC112495281 n=1 Tax=Cephus cinctus TaxID=211228 RepID=A0AAJ7RUJ5_CEPCN|nr:uncharacterized protein LOC112495281 [Cephus cinctus]